MQDLVFAIDDMFYPQIIAAGKDYVVAYKPPFMHSAPVRTSVKDNFLDWCCVRFLEIAVLPGRRVGEGGLLHRLDYETHGIMLLARTESGMKNLLVQQKDGKIIKEYSALAAPPKEKLPGFPKTVPSFSDNTNDPHRIISAFRPYGPGRKSVRPVVLDIQSDVRLDEDKEKRPYVTEILKTDYLPSGIVSFRLSIFRGFRHQIRCHLAWHGTPILNDDLYGGREDGNVLLALRAVSLTFNEPVTEKKVKFAIPELM